MLIPVFNPETDGLEKSYLSGNYSAGIQTITVKNSDRFAVNDRIMLGEQGQEKTEIVTVNSVNANGTDLVIGTTVFPHSSDDPVYKLRFDQVKFYRSTTTNAGPWTLVSTQALDVDNEDLETKYDDVSGLAAYYYYFTFYHSLAAVESANSDVIGGSGWRREQVGNIIDEILREVSDQNETNVTRQELLGCFNDVNDDLQLDNTKPPEFLKARMALARTANRNYIDYPVDTYGKQVMWKFRRMDYNFTDPTTSPVTNRTRTIPVLDSDDFRNKYDDNTISSATVSDRQPAFMTLDDDVLRFRFSNAAATSLGNVFYLHYWKYFDVIDSEGDVIETPTPKIYKLYCKAIYYRKRAITESSYTATADRWMADYTVEKAKYKGHNRKDKGTPRGFRPRTSTNRTYRRG